MSRPTVFTKTILQKLEQAFAMGCSDEEACFYAGISPSSLYNHQKQNKEFLEQKQLLHQRPIFEARKSLLEGIKINPGLALKFLERRKRDEFSLKVEYDDGSAARLAEIGENIRRIANQKKD